MGNKIAGVVQIVKGAQASYEKARQLHEERLHLAEAAKAEEQAVGTAAAEKLQHIKEKLSAEEGSPTCYKQDA